MIIPLSDTEFVSLDCIAQVKRSGNYTVVHTKSGNIHQIWDEDSRIWSFLNNIITFWTKAAIDSKELPDEIAQALHDNFWELFEPIAPPREPIGWPEDRDE